MYVENLQTCNDDEIYFTKLRTPSTTEHHSTHPSHTTHFSKFNVPGASSSSNYTRIEAPSPPSLETSIFKDQTEVNYDIYSAFVSSCCFEKIRQTIKKEGGKADVYSAAIKDFDEQFDHSFMQKALIPSDEPDMTVNLDHLTDRQKTMLLPLQNKYKDIGSRGKHHVGTFPHWEADAQINESMNCFQKCRSHDLPDLAWEDLQLYKANNVFSIADEGIDQFTANITLTKRPATKEQNFSTKADKTADKIKRKNREKSADQPKETAQRQLYRLSIDFRSVNKATLNDCTISLPTLQSIENSFQDCHISTFDISNCFYHLKLNQRSEEFSISTPVTRSGGTIRFRRGGPVPRSFAMMQ